MGTDAENKVIEVVKSVAGHLPQSQTLTAQSDLATELGLTELDKLDLIVELEEEFNVPPPLDARADAALVVGAGVPWVVSALATYLEGRSK